MNRNILIFEWLCGGGLWVDGIAPPSPFSDQLSAPHDLQAMLDQGSAMAVALTSDLCAAGEQVTLPIDRRLEAQLAQALAQSLGPADHRNLTLIPIDFPSGPVIADQLIRRLLSLANEFTRCVLIAPETDRCLEQLVQRFSSAGVSLASPNEAFVRLTTNKLTLKSFLREQRFPHLLEDQACENLFSNALAQPATLSQELKTDPKPPFPFPFVIKPVDGAGSESTFFVGSTNQWETTVTQIRSHSNRFFAEPFLSGTPASVSVLSALSTKATELFANHQGVVTVTNANGHHVLLPPMEQCFDRSPLGHFVGARPLPNPLADRARKIAIGFVASMPPTNGYFGIDLILSEDGQRDVLLEVNPRLTMSYLDLRREFGMLLATSMLNGC